MLNIVIPIAGQGSKFRDAGYKQSKPFILVDKLPMVQKVIWNLAPPRESKVIVICLEKDYDECLKTLVDTFSEWDTDWISYQIVKIPVVTEGTVCTVLKAKSLINNNDELVIANCDQLVLQPYYFQESIKFYRTYKADGGILCFYQNQPIWSYVKLSNRGMVLKVVEKEVISNFATVGIYYYRRGSDFVKNAEEMIRRNLRCKGEFYVAPIYNFMLKKRGTKILPWLANDVYGLGSPEYLQKYLERKNS